MDQGRLVTRPTGESLDHPPQVVVDGEARTSEFQGADGVTVSPRSVRFGTRHDHHTTDSVRRRVEWRPRRGATQIGLRPQEITQFARSLEMRDAVPQEFTAPCWYLYISQLVVLLYIPQADA